MEDLTATLSLEDWRHIELSLIASSLQTQDGAKARARAALARQIGLAVSEHRDEIRREEDLGITEDE